MKRRIISRILLLVMVFTILPVQALAVEPTYTPSEEYQESIYYQQLKDVKLTGNQAEDIVNIALSQLGYHNGSSTNDLGGDNMYSFGNYTEYGRFYGLYDAWCAMFVSWCARQAGIKRSIIKNSTVANTAAFGIEYYGRPADRSKGIDYSNFTPQKGDLIIFDWKTDGYDYRESAAAHGDHVGIVTKVDDTYVYTIEGNTGGENEWPTAHPGDEYGAVRQKRYRLDYSEIKGYGRPKYDTAFSVATPVYNSNSVVKRDDGTWLFPAAKKYYDCFSDWCCCSGYDNCILHGNDSECKSWGDSAHSGQRGHNGIDIAMSDYVYAAASGTAHYPGYLGARGYTVIIEHKIPNTNYSYYSYYQHLNKSYYKKYESLDGKTVNAGDTIGYSGSTGGDYGTHLHFGIVRGESSSKNTYGGWDSILGSIEYVRSQPWLIDYSQQVGRIVVNPAENWPTKTAGATLAAIKKHAGSVKYTFDKSKVTIGGGTTTVDPVKPKPGAVTVTNKSSFTTAENVVITWKAATNAEKYGLTVVNDKTNAVVCDGDYTGTSKNLGKLAAGKYRYQMRAWNSTGWGELTARLYFTVSEATKPKPGAVTITNKNSFTTAEDVVITWKAATNAEKYGLTVVNDKTNAVVCDGDFTGTSKNLGKLAEGKYRYQMRAWNSTGWGELTSKYYFTVTKAHTHTYTGSYFDTQHPHKEYQKCSCGAIQYTGKTQTVKDCKSCFPTSHSYWSSWSAWSTTEVKESATVEVQKKTQYVYYHYLLRFTRDKDWGAYPVNQANFKKYVGVATDQQEYHEYVSDTQLAKKDTLTYDKKYNCFANQHCSGDYNFTTNANYLYYKGTQTVYSYRELLPGSHSFSGSYYDSTHPHNIFQKCSCGEIKYTGATQKVASCSLCYPVASVSLSESQLNLLVGQSKNLTATVYPTNAANKAVQWGTSNAAIATVSGSGEVKAVSPGSVSIVVTTADGKKTAICTVTVSNIVASGTCGGDQDGKNLAWTLDIDGLLTISGAGTMSDAANGSAPWFANCQSIRSVKFDAEITTIGDNMFLGCNNLTEVIIPDSVVSIGNGAFSACASITNLTIPKNLTGIGENAFSDCNKLGNITIPSSVTEIGAQAFKNCSALKDVYFEGSRTQWNAIDIATEGNDPLRNATIHFAQPEPQPPVETSGTIAVSSVRARAGQTITVKVDLSANKGISNMRLQMSYPEGFTLERIQRGGGLSTLFFTPPGKLTANPVNFVWDGTEADTSEGCILELTFRIADTVAVGEYSISLSYQKDDVLDGSLEGIDLTLQSGTVSVVEFTRGDIDGDGVIGMKDLGALRKYFAGGYDAGNFVMEAADLDGDGVVTMKDLGVLRRYLAGGYDINLGE